MTVQEMCLFLATVVQMGHDQRDVLKDYWLTLEQYFVALYRKTKKWDRFSHILIFLYFSDIKNEPDKTDENYDQLWKMRAIFDKLRNSYVNYYVPTEKLAGDEISVLFKGRVNFKQHIPKKHKRFGIKLYKPCDSKGYAYTHNMTMYLGKDRKHVTSSFTATHAAVTGLAARIEHLGHNL